MKRVIELWVDGSTDARETTSAEDSEPGGALPPLINGAIDDMVGGSVPTDLHVEWLANKLRAVKAFRRTAALDLSGWARKVTIALDVARTRDPSILIVAIRDNDQDAPRASERDGVMEALRKTGRRGLVAGLCVEALEAWLLADAGAFKRCFGRAPGRGLSGKPESVADPKGVLRAAIRTVATVERSWSERYNNLAKHVDRQILKRKCPKGFGRPCRDLEEFIVPELKSGA